MTDLRDRLAAYLNDNGYVPTTTPVLQPIEPFLELSGEDIRRRIFVTQNQAGVELCLRPEFTIPICQRHRETADGQSADYSYSGPVFRLAESGPGEFLQAGVESIGRDDIAAADAEILALALDGLRTLGVSSTAVRLGDMGLTTALLDALEVPPIAKRRTLRALAANRSLDDIVSEPGAEDPNAGLLAAIQGQDPASAKAFIENILSIAGISRVGGRTAGDIAERFLSKATARANGGAGLNAANLAIIETYRAIRGPLAEALDRIRALFAGHSIRSAPLDQSLSLLEERLGFMEARELAVGEFEFSSGFVRNLDYYTGFIFEIAAPASPGSSAKAVLAGGGRYDSLLTHLGSPTPAPAVGCAFWLDQIASSRDSHV